MTHIKIYVLCQYVSGGVYLNPTLLPQGAVIQVTERHTVLSGARGFKLPARGPLLAREPSTSGPPMQQVFKLLE